MSDDAPAKGDATAGGTGPGEPAAWLDERGRRCPLPIVALGRAAAAHPAGTLVGLLADDPAAEYDVPAWCRLKGGTYLGTTDVPDGGPGTAYLVRLPR